MNRFLLITARMVLALLAAVCPSAYSAEISGVRVMGIDGTERFTLRDVAPDSRILWYAPAGCRIVSGQGTGEITLRTSFISQSGELRAIVTDANGQEETVTMPLKVHRPIASHRDYTIKAGESVEIGGIARTEADIYYTDAGQTEDGLPLKEAHRVTVTPVENAEMMRPFLQTATDKSIFISWKASSEREARIEYGKEGLDKSITVTPEALADNYYWYTAKVEGLEANTRYDYRIVCGDYVSETYNFRTVPAAGENRKLRVLLMGDHQIKSRSGYEWLMKAASRKLKELYGTEPNEAVSMIMNVGDQVDVGTLTQYEEIHLNKSALLSPYIPIMTCVGNHETYQDPEMKNWSAHNHYEDLEYRGISSGTENYYAYQLGRVLFVVLSTEHAGAAQKLWVRKVVDAVKDDGSVDFVVSVNHRPIQAEQYIGDISAWVRNEIIPILSETDKHVLNFGGHHHLYHRGQLKEYPLYHIINGGASWDQMWGMSSEQDFDDVQKTIDYWGYQILEFDFDKKEMKAECYAIGNREIVTDNILIDSFSRRLGAGRPEAPVLDELPEQVVVPYEVKGSPYESESGFDFNSVQVQVSGTADFANLELDVMRDVENLYGSTGNPLYLPVDKNEGLDITRFMLTDQNVKNGPCYVRMRYRDSNMEWSDWSEPRYTEVSGAMAGDPVVWLDKKIYAPGEKINISYNCAPVGKSAWIGIYRKEMEPGPVPSVAWTYTNDVSGVYQTGLNEPNEYYAVLFEDSGYTEASERVPFVVGSTPRLELEKTHFEEGEEIVVNYKDAPLLDGDWIGVYKMGQDHVQGVGSSSWRTLTGTDKDGRITLSTGETPAYRLKKGYYYVGYFTRGGYFMPTDSVTFSVGSDITEIVSDKVNYRPGEDINIMYKDGPGTPKDWLGIYHEGEVIGQDEISGFYYTYGATEGIITIPGGEHKAGDYFLGLFIYDSYDMVSNMIHITVGKAPALSFEGFDTAGVSFTFEDDEEWRNGVTAVELNGCILEPEEYMLQPGRLFLTADALENARQTCSLVVRSEGWQPSTSDFEAIVTGLKDIDSKVIVSRQGRELLISGASEGDAYEVFTIQGVKVAAGMVSGSAMRLALPAVTDRDILIVRIGGKTFKM